MLVNRRSLVLSLVSIVLRVMGWLLVALSLYLLIYEVIVDSFLLPNHYFGDEDKLELVLGVATLVSGFVTVALGEVIGVLFAIELNTRGGRPLR